MLMLRKPELLRLESRETQVSVTEKDAESAHAINLASGES